MILRIVFLLFLFGPAPVFNRSAAEGLAENTEIEIDVRYQNDLEIFSPQTPIVLEIRPTSSGRISPELNGEKILNLHVAVFHGLEDQTSAPSKRPVTELELQIPLHTENPWIPVSLLAPVKEGVYEISVSLQRREERSGNSILSIPGYQKRPQKILAEKTVQCVVLATSARPVGDLLSRKKELLETVEAGQSSWKKRLTQITVLPKVGNLASPLTTPLNSTKLSEIPRLGGFRERPSKGGGGPETERPSTEEKTPELAVGEIPISSGPIAELYEQWKANPSGNIGNGYFEKRQKLPPPSNPAGALSSQSEAALSYFALTSPESTDTQAWEALPLSVGETGKPHLLELDYLPSHPQALEISVVEILDFDGQSAPVVTTRSDMDVAEELVSDTAPETILTHRLLFWPRTKNPMLLLVNRQHGRDALFGKARLYRIAEEPIETTEEPKTGLPKPFDEPAHRLVAGYLHDGNLLKRLGTPFDHRNFSSHPAFWQEAFTGTNRLIDTLHRCGYDGAMLTVLSKETALLPMTRTADDKFVKDQLELLFRLFDRERMTLIPAIDFNMPLRELEERVQENPAAAYELLGDFFGDRPDGPRYNLLHPLVQEAMLGTVKELLDRYSRHPSFGGLAVQLTPDGYAQLPILSGGVDDRTFEEFLREIRPDDGVVFPRELLKPEMESATPEHALQQKEQRFEARARFLQSDSKAWEAWLAWRTGKVRDFYARLAQTVAVAKPEATLYLAGGTMLDQPDIRRFCAPSLQHWTSLGQILRMTGFDLTMLKEIPSLVFLRPSRIVSGDPDSCYEQFDTPDLGVHFKRNDYVPGTLFYHDGFAAPAGNRNRRRFVKQLAQSDVLSFFDGGKTLPGGSADSLYSFLAAYRRLPPVPFQTFSTPSAPEHSGDAEKTLQPLTLRFARHANRLIVYLVNDAPFGIETTVSFTPTRSSPVELGGRRSVPPVQTQTETSNWTVALEAYDFLAVVLEDPDVSIRDVSVRRPARICGSDGYLRHRVDGLSERIHTAQQGIAWDKLGNPGFEISGPGESVPGSPAVEIEGWKRIENPAFGADLDSAVRFSGRSSLRLTGLQGIETEPGTVLSCAFEAPSTGRLFVSFCIGVPENGNSIPLNVILTGRYLDRPWFRSFAVQPQLQPSANQTPGGVRWHRMIVPFDRLPDRSLEDFCLGFQMFGPGTVWIDEISLYQVSFTPNEIKVLQRLALAAGARCSQERVSDLLTILEGYWARFLFQRIPDRPIDSLPARAQAPVSALASGNKPYAEKTAPPPKTTPVKKENPGFLDRIKGYFVR